MFVRTMFAMSAFTVVAFAADMTGAWKLNTAKSKYTGIPAPKEMTATYTPEGQGWKYEGKGTSGEGQPTNLSFVYAKDNEDIKMTGYPYADTLVLKNGKSDTSTGIFKREGKKVGTVKRTLSKDGKTMIVSANLTLPDGKKARYSSVYEKE